MIGLVLTAVAIFSAILWLSLLLATAFNPLTVSAGLLVAVAVTGSHDPGGARPSMHRHR
jgi:hypothetical protein